jgi:hypothetical protein
MIISLFMNETPHGCGRGDPLRAAADVQQDRRDRGGVTREESSENVIHMRPR